MLFYIVYCSHLDYDLMNNVFDVVCRCENKNSMAQDLRQQSTPNNKEYDVKKTF